MSVFHCEVKFVFYTSALQTVSADQLNQILCSLCAFPQNIIISTKYFKSLFLLVRCLLEVFCSYLHVSEPLFVWYCVHPYTSVWFIWVCILLCALISVFFHLITVQMGIKAAWFIWQRELFSDLFKQNFDSFFKWEFFCISWLSCWPLHIKCVLLLLFICCQNWNLSLK